MRPGENVSFTATEAGGGYYQLSEDDIGRLVLTRNGKTRKLRAAGRGRFPFTTSKKKNVDRPTKWVSRGGFSWHDERTLHKHDVIGVIIE